MPENLILEKKPIRVGLYFGSFNPIHIGHLSLAEYLIEHNIVDEVWFVVSPNNPLKSKAELLDHHLRFDMVRGAITEKDFPFKACDTEFTMPVPSYTINTLHILSEQYPIISFSLLIGSDNALVFDKWKDYQSILNEYPIFVYPRHGYDFKEVEKKYPQMKLLNTPYYEISSTEIRKKIAENEDYSMLVTPEVKRFIERNNLYKEVL